MTMSAGAMRGALAVTTANEEPEADRQKDAGDQHNHNGAYVMRCFSCNDNTHQPPAECSNAKKQRKRHDNSHSTSPTGHRAFSSTRCSDACKYEGRATILEFQKKQDWETV
ncbi:MAG: hypothetical protein JO348_01390 [Alphaproteobacteria bacterium]|nr:hypothetical protein [Alphaproteobacteria bacterium]